MTSAPRPLWNSILALALIAGCTRVEGAAPAPAAPPGGPLPMPLVIGETVRLASQMLGEQRVVNVYLPPGYRKGTERYPVLYMPDGGIEEDFPHVTGVIDVSIRNQVIRPLIVVGIENTERRRDLTPPTEVAEDRAAAPHAGGAARFRQFLRDELKPYVAAHYRATAESAIVGESLAGLFVLDTLLIEPTLFDSYISVDPSLWWNAQALVRSAPARFAAWSVGPKALYLATADVKETQDAAATLLAAIRAANPRALALHYQPLPDEHHSTIYPVAAVKAFRILFAPPARSGG